MIIGGGGIACEYDSQDSRSIKTHIHAALTHPEVILECLVEPIAKKRNLIKSEKKFDLEEKLDRERSKLKKVREKTRDYRKLITRLDDFKDMSPDEIKVKLDQIYDWNDKTIK